MDYSKEMNKPMFIVREANGTTSFLSPNQMNIRTRMASLYAYLAKKLQISESPKVIFTKDEQNAKNPFGFTGYYDPGQKLIRLYITARHDNDILRSFAHEVIHHWQNLNGTLQGGASGEHYAQNDENMRKREMEAYLFGNILFRDWQDENRYGKPEKEPEMPQPILENIQIQNSLRVRKGFEALLRAFIKDGSIKSVHRDLTSGDMNPADFINDFSQKLMSSLTGQIQTINNRGNWENQPDMIREGKVVACPKCKAAFDYNEQPEMHPGVIKCPFCEGMMDQGGNVYG